jgi:hypothetical protein
LSKRSRVEQHNRAPPVIADGAGKRVTHKTANALIKGIEAANRRARLEARIMTEYARTINAWIFSYKTTEKQLITDSFS